ncbi:MAG: aminoacyl-tRNA hydrolase, partial [Planctomycetes bacterium]|nr:aminoacyl-tRNA hydrolase [Planctomycetota bacterium]
MEMDVCSGIKIVVGLGNPGKEYAETRHNLGFRVVDLLAEQMNISVKKKKFSSLFGQLEFGNENIILLKPQQFMNRSGQAVATAVGFYKAKIKNLLVVTDDMAIEPG